jgi:hypothetical protein
MLCLLEMLKQVQHDKLYYYAITIRCHPDAKRDEAERSQLVSGSMFIPIRDAEMNSA